MIRARHISLVLLLALAACADPIPDQPTWFDDVQPIIRANCARCHGADPYTPALAAKNFRLDRYVAGDTTTSDAFDRAGDIVQQVDEYQTMPLNLPLGDREREILVRWNQAGAPKGNRDNTPPTAVLISPTDGSMTVDQSIDLTLRSNDADGDGLVVAIGARPSGSQNSAQVLVSGIGGGLRSVTADTGLLTSKQTYDFVALVDDGYSDNPADNITEIPLLTNVMIDHGARGTAPTVQLLDPNGPAGIAQGTHNIIWTASDPDPGDVLTIDLDLVKVDASGNETVVGPIKHGLANSPASFAWDTSSVPTDEAGTPIEYKVRVTATDSGAKNVRSDESDSAFKIIPMTTTSYTWSDVKPIFAQYCVKCHGEPSANGAPEYFRLDKYNAADPVPPINTDEGAYDVSGLIYQKLTSGLMPPAREPQPSAADVAKILDWIGGGSPGDSGSTDAPPMFTWSMPNNSSTTNVSSTSVTLQWTASDDMGSVTGTLSIAKLSGPKTDMQATCDSSLTGWTDIPGADVTTGSLAYTLPGTGCYCLRGVVTDSASQTTTAIATKPVRYATGVGGVFCP